MLSRKERVKLLRDNVAKEWTNYWWDSIYTNRSWPSFDYINLAGNPNLTLDIIKQNMHLPWNWLYLSIKPIITLEFIVENPHEDWNWYALSANSGLDVRRDILANKTLPWKWEYVVENPTLTIDIVTDPVTQDIFKEYGYASALKKISFNPRITMDDITRHPELDIDIELVCKNPNLTIEFVKSNLHLLIDEWIWRYISKNPGIKIRDIIDNPELPWIYENVLMNPNMTYIDFLANPQIDWKTNILLQYVKLPFAIFMANIDRFTKYSIDNVSSNPGTQLADITANPDIPWCWTNVSLNPNLTLDFVLANPDKDWEWTYIIQNPNIMLDELCNLIKSRHRLIGNNTQSAIYSNPFTASKQKFFADNYRRHLASYRIQQHWHRIRSDPRHPVGRKRLEREYERLFGSK